MNKNSVWVSHGMSAGIWHIRSSNEKGVERLEAIAYCPTVAVVVRDSLRKHMGIGRLPLDKRDVLDVDRKMEEGRSRALALNKRSKNALVRRAA